MDGPIVSVEGVWKLFGREAKQLMSRPLRNQSKADIQAKSGAVLALRDVTLDVRKGEFFVIMGLSGSGKSTLIRTLVRLIEPTVGRIVVNGEDILTFPSDRLMQYRRNAVAMVFQNFGLFPHYTVLDNAAYGLKVRREERSLREQKARAALKTVGLGGWEAYYPESLSGGMQQRVGLARALATDPEILLMDEPFSGLDPLIRRQLQDELVELQGRLQKTVVFVTHDLHEALKLGDRVAIMRDGEVIQIGTPEEIISNPADGYVRDFTRDASPARVLTAAGIMQEPAVLLYRWQGPRTARKILRDERCEWAFVVTRIREYVGLVTLDDLDRYVGEGGSDFAEVLRDGVEQCAPDMYVEQIFPLARETAFALPVVDESGRFLGEVRRRAVFDAMTGDHNGEGGTDA
ncbi:MAG: glycine betaine/L-proline ABC transporter ATP-binding protein [Spirochaetaceae bacterium]|nr:MAG: glycine betaine/L-proline ABC transporter ATP-binding protein [Spirochaetaceae bacterium]